MQADWSAGTHADMVGVCMDACIHANMSQGMQLVRMRTCAHTGMHASIDSRAHMYAHIQAVIHMRVQAELLIERPVGMHTPLHTVCYISMHAHSPPDSHAGHRPHMPACMQACNHACRQSHAYIHAHIVRPSHPCSGTCSL